MRSRLLPLVVASAGCAGQAIVTSSPPTHSVVTPVPVPPSPACVAARDARTKAAELDKGGHESLALAKINEANAACPAERAESKGLEDAIAANLSNDAPNKGTPESMRAKMREADAAERTKDWAKAKGLYLDAWAEQHPTPRALEDAARMAALAGDAAESRRLRDRALAEAEGATHATAQLRASAHLMGGAARLVGTTLTLAENGKVVARDTVTGELRVLLDVPFPGHTDTTLSSHGTLAFTGTNNSFDVGTVSVYDVLTGELLFKIPKGTRVIASPDDKLLVVRDDAGADGHARVFDVATGQVKAKLAGKWFWEGRDILGFSGDDAHVLVVDDDSGGVIRDMDATTGAYGSLRIAAAGGVTGLSPDGHYLAYLDAAGSDAAAVHIRDLVANKDITQWTAHFHSVDTLAVASDAKSIVTGSYRSLRLWDVAQKKQTFIHDGFQTFNIPNQSQYGFDDDGKIVVVGGYAAKAWDVATGKATPLAPIAAPKNVLHVVKAPDGVALVLEDEVRIVPEAGEPRSVCKGLAQPPWTVPPMIGPTSVTFSPSGKLFACAMWDGWVHVLDASSWEEKAVIKRGATSTIDRPVDLVFSADDKTLTDVSNVGFVVYDASTGKEASRVAFRHGTAGFAPRHARFDDGSVLVRTWSGTAAIFAADGTWQRDVKLLAGVPADGLDAFSTSGKTYAAALGKTLHVVDLATGDDKTTPLPATAKSLAVSGDGKSVMVATSDGVVSVVAEGTATPLAHAKGIRVGFAGQSLLVWSDKSVIETYASSTADPTTLEIDAGGVLIHLPTGAFDTRGKPEIVCVVGSTYLSRATCDDRNKEGLVASWLTAVR